MHHGQVYSHLLNPFNEGQKGVSREPRLRDAMSNLEAEVQAFGGWEKVQCVKVLGKNVDREAEEQAEELAAVRGE